MNPGISTGPALYILIFFIILLATVIFAFHLLEERKVLLPHESEEEALKSKKPVPDQSAESIKTPFEVDVDEIAENIIPRIKSKESIEDFSETILQNLVKHFDFVQGIIYLKDSKTMEFRSVSSYAYTSDSDPAPFKAGEGIPGQVAKNKAMVNITSIPEGYLQVQSGLGSSSPDNLLIIPLLLNKETIGIIELASFHSLDKETEWAFKNLAKIIGNSLVTKLKSAGKR